MADAGTVTTGGGAATGGINPMYFYGGIIATAIVGSVAMYLWFTKKPVSSADVSVKKQEEQNTQANNQQQTPPPPSTPAAPNYVGAATSVALNPSTPNSAGGINLGDAVIIREGISPKRLNDQLGYVSAGIPQSVTLKLGTAWGWTDAAHNLVTSPSQTIANVIVKADDKKIADFYEVKLADVLPAGVKGTVTKVTDYLSSLFDSGEYQKTYLGADGFGEL